MGWVQEIIPRRSGRGLDLPGRDSGGVEEGATVVRYARGGGGAAPTLIRSSADERNAVQQARAIRTWGGHCISVFVPFPRAAFYTEHKAEVDRAVALTDRKGGKADATSAPLEVAIVDGHLDGRAVGGVLFIRSDPDADGGYRFRRPGHVQKLTDLATPDPASPPMVTCSMPELDHVVARLRVANPSRY